MSNLVSGLKALKAAAPVTDESGDARYTADLRNTARWLVGSSAAVGAILVAGVRLGDLGSLYTADKRLTWVAVLSVLAMLTAAAVTLWFASSVLVAPRRTIGELDRLDRLDYGSDPPTVRTGAPETGLIKYLVITRGDELLWGSSGALWGLTQGLGSARQSLLTGRPVKIEGHRYNPKKPADAEALAALSEELKERVRWVVNAAEAWETLQRYKRLNRVLLFTIPLFVCGVVAFVWMTTFKPKSPPVNSPIPVTVIMPATPPCPEKTLSGVAVGGTLDAPKVRTPYQQGCKPLKLDDTREMMVIPSPIVSPKKAGA